MTDVKDLYDAVIIGGGPAGLTAALYLARARYRVLVVEKDHFGGQITITNEVVNYPGVFSTSGSELSETMRKQAEAFGAEFLLAEVTDLDMSGDVKVVRTTKGERPCLSVLLATGAHPRHIGFVGEEDYQGHGVAYCATCDGEFFTGKEVFVIGGGFAAAEESVFLTKYAKHVTVLVREEAFTCAPASSEAARTNPNITVLYNTQVESVAGDSALRSITYKNLKTGEKTTFAPEDGDSIGVFVFAGYAPETDLVKELAQTDDYSYLITNEHQETTCEGLFGAGDVCQKPLRQVATAIGQAATTATEMERYIKRAQEKTGLVPQMNVTRISSKKEAPEASAAKTTSDSGELFTDDMKAQLNAVFERMARPLVLQLELDQRPVSEELVAYMEELSSMTDKLSVQTVSGTGEKNLPVVRVCAQDGTPTGLAFHGVPGGHEFTSFVLGLYNAAGPGQPISDEDKASIAAIESKTHLQVLVGLSCTMCPDVVVAAQRIAADNPQVTCDVYDINHFKELKDTYDVMSVPCLVINDGQKVDFGKKNLSQILSLIP